MNIDAEVMKRIIKMRDKMIKDGTFVQHPLLSETIDLEQALKRLKNCGSKKGAKKKKAIII